MVVQSDFDLFSEMVERRVSMSWRAAFGRTNRPVIERVNSYLFTREDAGSKWVFSLGLRVGKTWVQSRVDVSKVNMDELDVPPGGQGPTNRASEVAERLVGDVSKKAVANA